MPRVYNVKDKDIPEGAVFIGRGTIWGNEFRIGVDGNRIQVIARHRRRVHNSPSFIEQIKRELRDKDLICFCRPKLCHGWTYIRIAND